MTPQQFKTTGIVCLVLCAICIFIAWERYQANADAVSAFSNLAGQFGADSLFGGKITAGTPAATKYALFFALLSGAGGIYCLRRAGKPVA